MNKCLVPNPLRQKHKQVSLERYYKGVPKRRLPTKLGLVPHRRYRIL